MRQNGRCNLVPRSLVLLALSVAAGTGCREKIEPIVSDFSESFDRESLGPDWRDSGGHSRIVNGELAVSNAHHHPVWLRRKLPTDVSIELDARPSGPNGDIRVVLFGDGKSANPDAEACQSSGYELVFGGWKNKLSVLCRGDEKGGGHQRARTDWPVISGQTYHFYITRKDGIVAWYINGHDMMAWKDPKPLDGPGHDAFGFDGGDGDVFFDNLVVGPYHL
jgi:Farnesoic acid 0-methyl transferase